jgi:hypothetical protein
MKVEMTNKLFVCLFVWVEGRIWFLFVSHILDPGQEAWHPALCSEITWPQVILYNVLHRCTKWSVNTESIRVMLTTQNEILWQITLRCTLFSTTELVITQGTRKHVSKERSCQPTNIYSSLTHPHTPMGYEKQTVGNPFIFTY